MFLMWSVRSNEVIYPHKSTKLAKGYAHFDGCTIQI
jgi:hypothetical protein